MIGRAKALEAAKGLSPTPKNLERLRAKFGEVGPWAILQWELRARAAAKFADADNMLFQREALEMATHEAVAKWHASHYPNGEPVADLTAGIGGDLRELVKRGPAVGYELDPELAEYAQHNSGAKVILGDSLACARGAEYVWADPGRRSGGARTFDPARFAPNPQTVLDAFPEAALLGMKLSPMLRDDYLESLGGRLDFVSFGGECREVCLWRPGSGRFAVLLPDGLELPSTDPPRAAEEPGRYLYEADPAAIRAHALGGFGLRALGSTPGYLTGDELIASPWLKAYRVLWHGRPDFAHLRSELRRLNAKTPELKQRGAGYELADVRKKLKCEGDRPLIVAFWAGTPKIHAAILEMP